MNRRSSSAGRRRRAFHATGALALLFALAGGGGVPPPPPPPPPPPLPTTSNGITFDHANLNDLVRMVGEPDIEIDNHGGIYVSGPGGSTTQASWFWKSLDNGVQWYLVGCPGK